MADSHYPYTYACDLLRSQTEFRLDKGGVPLSRADASKIRQLIAKIIGMEDEELAKKLADYYQTHQEEIKTIATTAVTAAFGCLGSTIKGAKNHAKKRNGH
jgi:elongation factor P hydroxylase